METTHPKLGVRKCPQVCIAAVHDSRKMSESSQRPISAVTSPRPAAI